MSDWWDHDGDDGWSDDDIDGTELYKRSARKIMNCKFADTLDDVETVIFNRDNFYFEWITEKAWLCSWALYYILIDQAVQQYEASAEKDALLDPEARIPQNKRLELVNLVRTGTIWDKTVAMFGKDLQNVPVSLVYSLVALSSRHCKDLDFITYYIEWFLSLSERSTDHDLYFAVLTAFVLKVLPSNGNFDYSRAIVAHSEYFSDPETRRVILEKVDVLERNYNDGGKAIDKTDNNEELNGGTQSDQRGEVYDKTEEEEKREEKKEEKEKEEKKDGSILIPQNTPISIPTNSALSRLRGAGQHYWFDVLRSASPNTRLIRSLSFVLIFALTFASKSIRANVIKILGTFANRSINTLGMGFKVSYL